jgi:hypothetical protein
VLLAPQAAAKTAAAGAQCKQTVQLQQQQQRMCRLLPATMRVAPAVVVVATAPVNQTSAVAATAAVALSAVIPLLPPLLILTL